MHTKIYFIATTLTLIILACIVNFSCVTDPIKSIKNDSDKMEILMNHIATDNNYRATMVEKLTSKGDRQKLAEVLVKEEDMSRILLSKIMETEKGKEDIVARVGNRRDLITQAIGKSLMMYEYRGDLLDAFLKDEEMVKFMKNSDKLKEAFENVEE